MPVHEKLKKIASESPGDWLVEMRQELDKSGARANARKIALSVLRILREQHISQTDLAEKMGVSRQQVTKIVKGKENFTFETIEKLEKALGVTLMTIAGPSTIPFPHQGPAVFINGTMPVAINTGIFISSCQHLGEYFGNRTRLQHELTKTVTLLQSWYKSKPSHHWSVAGSVITGSMITGLMGKNSPLINSASGWILATHSKQLPVFIEIEKEESLVADTSIYSQS